MVLLADPLSPEAQALTRRERRKLEVQNKICTSAVALFEAQGIEPTTVEEICELADVARKTFYNYYPSKQELIRALCDTQLFSRTEAVLQSVIEKELSTAESLKAYITQLLEDLSDYGKIDRMLIREAMLDVSSDSRATQHLAKLIGMFTELVSRGQKQGDVKKDFAPDFYAEVILTSLNGILTAWMSHDGYPIEQRLQNLIEFHTDSICLK